MRYAIKPLLLSTAIALLALTSTEVRADSLERAVVNALLNSDARKAARSEITAKVSDLEETRAGFGATVSAYADIRMQVIENSDRFAPADNADPLLGREAGLTVTLPIYDGGRTAALVRRDAARVDAEIIRLIDETETLALNAVQAYIDLARYQGILSLTQSNITRHSQIASRVRAQIDGGRLPSSDGLRVEERVAVARQTRVDAERALADALSRYQLNIGHKPKTAVTMPRMIAAPKSQAKLVAAAVQNSARLWLVDTQIEELEYKRQADAAEYAPRLNLQGGAYVGADMDGARGHESGAFVGLNMEWTLYRGGAKKHRDAATRDRIQRQYYEKADQARQITDLSQRTWNAYQKALADRELLKRQIRTTTRLVSVYQEEFDAGKRPLFDVLEAERVLFNYRVQDVNAHATLHFVLYKMLAVQTLLADHFGMAHAGRALAPDFTARASVNPRGAVFDITAPALDN